MNNEGHLISQKCQKHLAVFQVKLTVSVSILRVAAKLPLPYSAGVCTCLISPSINFSCAELHLQQSIMSDVSTADNVYL